MTYIKPETQEEIKRAAEGKILDVAKAFVTLKDTGKNGKSFIGKCPKCDGHNTFFVTPDKDAFYCNNCDFSGKGAISFIIKKQNKRFIDALLEVAQILNIVIPDPVPTTRKSKSTSKSKGQYLKKFLSGSGLTPKDVEAKIFTKDENRTITTSKVFKSGTLTYSGDIDTSVDDVIIEYYDLAGYPVKYEVKDNRRKRETKAYMRVRYQFPDEHLDADNRPIKYKSPRGSGTPMYIPQKIRDIYENGTQIDRIFVQEGEKKAEKACKHGIPSVAISGIQNFGYHGQFPPDLIKIIEKCGVKDIVLLFDSDWNQISKNIGINDNVQQRPLNFFYAALNFQKYVYTVKQRGISLRIFVGHVKENEKEDKGIDDLLINTLKDNPDKLKEDIETLIYRKNYDGEYLQLHNITIMGDLKLKEIWHLDSPQAFAEHHKEVLRDLPEFKIGKHSYYLDENDKLCSTRPIEINEQYWKETEKFNAKGDSRIEYEFDYVNCINFLQNRGYARFWRSESDWKFIHITPPTVRVVQALEIRDSVTDFTKSLRKKDVLELLYRGGTQYLGPDKLSNLEYQSPSFEEPSRDQQIFYFKNQCWKITSKGVQTMDYTEISHHIWANQQRDFKAKKLEDSLIKVTKDENGKFDYQVSAIGKNCHILQFLINTSNFTWRKEKIKIEVDADELQENKNHLIAKLCAIGYMLMSCKDRNVSRAVVAMDGKQSEVGQSNGRSGKSILGEMFKHLVPTVAINGKTNDIDKDQFVWTEVMEDTRVVFIDDVRTNFSLEFLFANITGDWTVNYKGGGRVTYPFSNSPKIYLTTNHALNGSGSSFIDRQWQIAFSDFYNENHKPLDDFGVLFFDEWDYNQWNLLYNLMAECVQLYLRFGVVQSPGERLEVRKLRQDAGEAMIMWADEYFSNPNKLNVELRRIDMYVDFKNTLHSSELKYYTTYQFKKRLQAYCKLKGYVFNPQKYDRLTGEPLERDEDGNALIDHKSGGVEYFTIGNDYYNTSRPETPSSTGNDGLPFENDQEDKYEF